MCVQLFVNQPGIVKPLHIKFYCRMPFGYMSPSVYHIHQTTLKEDSQQQSCVLMAIALHSKVQPLDHIAKEVRRIYFFSKQNTKEASQYLQFIIICSYNWEFFNFLIFQQFLLRFSILCVCQRCSMHHMKTNINSGSVFLFSANKLYIISLQRSNVKVRETVNVILFMIWLIII